MFNFTFGKKKKELGVQRKEIEKLLGDEMRYYMFLLLMSTQWNWLFFNYYQVYMLCDRTWKYVKTYWKKKTIIQINKSSFFCRLLPENQLNYRTTTHPKWQNNMAIIELVKALNIVIFERKWEHHLLSSLHERT